MYLLLYDSELSALFLWTPRSVYLMLYGLRAQCTYCFMTPRSVYLLLYDSALSALIYDFALSVLTALWTLRSVYLLLYGSGPSALLYGRTPRSVLCFYGLCDQCT